MARKTNSSWRRFSAPMRALPDFLIVGTQKGGTSSLFSHLSEHPRVEPGPLKEVRYFIPRNLQGLNVYRQAFPLRATLALRGAITGEATPAYLFHPWVAERVAKTLPAAKLICLLRDPVERAHSHHRMSVRRRRERRPFGEAIEDEVANPDQSIEQALAQMKSNPGPRREFGYVRRGQYAEHLERWFQHFPREQMLILQSERFFEDPSGHTSQVFRFLGLPEHSLVDDRPRHVGREAPPMDPAIRAALAGHFRPWNERLYDLIKTRFDWQESD